MAGKDSPKTSHKHVLIDKANQVALVSLSVAVAVFIFSLFAAQTLLKQNAYNQKVIGEKKAALKQIKLNRANVEELVKTYKSFATEPVNIIGGNPAGAGPKDGDNPRIVLDALPSLLDFPGFTSSMEKLVQTQGGVTIDNLGGTDGGSGDNGAAAASEAVSSTTVSPVEVPLSMAVSSDFTNIFTLVKNLESSIRPIYVTRMSLSGNDNSLRLDLGIKTFYQPEKKFEITTKAVD